ncbi:MAG: hypothetical protein JXP34_16800 [Planctomycetes bacterium]|nr:hypothetical protein [Planctomycetota bacterium]
MGFAVPPAAGGGEVVPDAPAPGGLAKLTLAEQRIPLLEGRLSVRMPESAKVEPRGYELAAAPAPEEDETRIVVDAGKERLVLMAYELYALAGGDLENAARADVEGAWGEKAATVELERLDVGPGLGAVAVIPPPPDGKGEANLVLAVYVGSADGTVQYLAFYVNPAGAEDVVGVTALCRKVACSVVAGSRKLVRSAGPRRFSGLGEPGFVITVPEGFVTSTQRGPDFRVHRLRKLIPLGTPPLTCGFYLGGHPTYLYAQADEPPEKVTSLTGRLLGKKVMWKTWTTSGRTTIEGIVPHPKGKWMAVHAFGSAGSQKEAEALRAIVETLQWEDPRESASVILYAFVTPYASALLFPVAAIVALAVEALVFRLLNRGLPWGRLVSTVLVINVASAVVGFFIAASLPSGLEVTVMGEGENQVQTIQHGSKYGVYAVLGYVLAFNLSMLIEWGIVRTLQRVAKLAKPFVTIALANAASYATLILMSMAWSWSFR